MHTTFFRIVGIAAALALLAPLPSYSLAPPSSFSDPDRLRALEVDESLRYSNQLLDRAVADGRFFAIQDLLNTEIGDIFSGSPRNIAARFANSIDFSPVEKAEKEIITAKMTAMLSDRAARMRLQEAFRALKKVVRNLAKHGHTGLEKRRFVLLAESGGLPPLVYVRSEEGRPVNVLAHAGRHLNSIYFELGALEYFERNAADPEKALQAIVRTENSFLEGKPDSFTAAERRVLDPLQDGFLARRVAAQGALWEGLQKELMAVLESSKAQGLSVAQIKRQFETVIRKTAGEDAAMQWHLIQQSEDTDHFLFTVSGRRFYLGYVLQGRKAVTDFALLQRLYDQLHFLMELVVPDFKESREPGASWEDLSGKIAYLYTENKAGLEQRGRRDLLELLSYVKDMDYSNGYLDELRALIVMIERQSDVPPIFAENPLADNEYVVLQTIVAPLKENELPEILEISAIRYRGLKTVQRFHTLVRPRQEALPEGALVKGIDAAALRDRALPTQEDALRRLKGFLGDLPIVTHGQMGKTKLLSQLLAAQRDQPLPNRVLDTQVMARRFFNANSSEYPFADHKLNHLFRKLGLESPSKAIRGPRLLRLYHLLVQEMALLAKKKPDTGGKSWEYLRMLGHLGPPEKVKMRREFEAARKKYPGPFVRVTTWEAIDAAIKVTDPKAGGIELVALDFDLTLANSKGWVGSDHWFRSEVRFQEQYGGNFFKILDKINKFLARMKFFELMEPGIPDVVREAQKKGIKVVLLTARQPWPGHREFLKETLDDLGIHLELEDLILTGSDTGAVDKPGGLYKYCMDTLGRVPNCLFMDDGLKYQIGMMEHPQLRSGMKMLAWYDPKSPPPADYSYGTYLQKGIAALRKDPGSTEALGYFFNAFGLSRDQASRDEVVRVGEAVLMNLLAYTGEKWASEFLADYVASAVNGDPDLMRTLILHETAKKSVGEIIVFETFFRDIQKVWGDIGFDLNNVRFIVEDPQLKRDREFKTLYDLESRVEGMKILANKKPVAQRFVLVRRPPGPDRAEFDGGTAAVRNVLEKKLADFFPDASAQAFLRVWLSSLNPHQLRDAFFALENIPGRASPVEALKALEGFFPPGSGRRALPAGVLAQAA